MFDNVYKHYNYLLRKSINTLMADGLLVLKRSPLFYNYLIINGTKLYNILKSYDKFTLSPLKINNPDMDEFFDCIIYVGKGNNNRKMQHIFEGKKLMELNIATSNKKCRTIIDLWSNGEGVVILQLFNEVSHYEALAREYSLIKTLEIDNIANIINGSPYGVMKYVWNENEIKNYGTMILFNALKMCIIDKPRLIKHTDVGMPIFRGKNVLDNWELEGILQCFLEL